MEEVNPDEAERLDIAYSDSFARNRRWEEMQLEDPVEDLDIFFQNIPGVKMLDVGCGWGRYVYRFLDHGLEYVGVDHSMAMLEAARESNPGIKFEAMSYRQLEFPDDTFDGLWCCCVFSGEPKHNMPNVLQELRRVLVPGGVMMVITPDVHGSCEEMVQDNKGNELFYYSSYTMHELCELLLENGFSGVERNHHFADGAISVLVRK